jgi:hypothetical protein
MDSFDRTDKVVEARVVLRRCQKLSWSEWIAFRRKNFPWKRSVTTVQPNERELGWEDRQMWRFAYPPLGL